MINKLFIFLAIVFIGCHSEPNITDADLDGPVLFDPSLYNPELYLISKKYPNPDSLQTKKPVIIVAHGYTATTFEWDEFKRFADSTQSGVLVSQVLLGGHGRDYVDFKKSTWHDWRSAIVEEFNALKKVGYSNISFAGSSTGAPLILNMVSSGLFQNAIEPKHIFMIDPIVIPANKTLSLVGILGPMLGYIESGPMTDIERKHWYKFRPQETLQELHNLISQTRVELEKGIQFPSSTSLHIYKSLYDDVVDRVSAVLLYNGIATYTPAMKHIDLIDSKIHVVTRLEGRSQVTEKDRGIQHRIFAEMITAVKASL